MDPALAATDEAAPAATAEAAPAATAEAEPASESGSSDDDAGPDAGASGSGESMGPKRRQRRVRHGRDGRRAGRRRRSRRTRAGRRRGWPDGGIEPRDPVHPQPDQLGIPRPRQRRPGQVTDRGSRSGSPVAATPPPHEQVAQLDSRTTNRVGSTTSSTWSAVRSCSTMSSRSRRPTRPISTPDWLTVVSGGIVNGAMSMLSKPTIDSRSGIATPGLVGGLEQPDRDRVGGGEDRTRASGWPHAAKSSRPSR